MTPAEIRKLRSRLGLTQQQMAERIGTTREQIARWETGAHKPRTMAVRLLISLKAGH